MNQILLLALVFTLGTETFAISENVTDVNNCHCNPGFEIRGTPGLGYKCFGKLTKIIVPCNTVHRPRCICTDHTGVLTDPTGTWCIRYGGAREIKRWNCENKDDWENFFTQHPDERPKPEA